jgi:hypothetical protein
MVVNEEYIYEMETGILGTEFLKIRERILGRQMVA